MIVMGDPREPQTEMGPICFPGQLEKIRRYVRAAVESGAELLSGGGDRGLGGLFFEPTVVIGVRNDDPLCQEEIFGPVLAMLPFSEEQEAVDLVNQSSYGLAAGVWTADVRRAIRVTRALKVGTVWVNA